MYAREFSHRQIATHFGCSVQAARSALKAEGVTSREKWAARKLRNQFPTKQSPNGPGVRKPRATKPRAAPKPRLVVKPRVLSIPAASPRRCGFVFDLALTLQQAA